MGKRQQYNTRIEAQVSVDHRVRLRASLHNASTSVLSYCFLALSLSVLSFASSFFLLPPSLSLWHVYICL